jgi:ferredoxin
MTKKIIVDQEKCIGCNTCPLVCPDIFELDETSYKAKVKKQPENIQDADPAITACPVSAISVEEE